MNKLKFSGHESFHCRPFWLKKGYDFVQSGQSFSDKAGIELGVGRNMVPAIRFWLTAFDLLNEKNQATELATSLFSEKGWDPFLEDEATLWLLHYKLSATNYSSIYNLVFSEIRKTRPEFSKNHLISHVNEVDRGQSENIVGKDFGVFTKSYLVDKSSDREDSYSGLFTDLELLENIGKDAQKNELYHVNNKKQESIPWQILLYAILENENYSSSISVKSMYSDEKGIGNIFALSKDALDLKMKEIEHNVKDITYSSDSGIKELQFKKKKPDPIDILKNYYEGNGK